MAGRLGAHLAQAQHRNAYALLAINVLGAGTGLLFWVLLTRVLGLPESEIGPGYAMVAMATLVAVVAKGGLDTALLRWTPRAGANAPALYRFALSCGAAVAMAVVALLAGAASLLALGAGRTPGAWILVAAMALLLLVTWLQDARFLATGDARPSLKRNVALSVGRILAPLAAVALAIPYPVATSWAAALGLSALVGLFLARRLPRAAGGEAVPRKAFLGTSMRNAASSAAEFLPGLMLAPMVLALSGESQAAYFGMAFTAASLLFLASSAVARSALAEMVRHPGSMALALRRALVQHAALVLPLAALAAALAPLALGIFGPAYAREGASTLTLLAVSTLLVAPGNLYLAILRARDSAVALAAFPTAMVILLVALTPPLAQAWGLPGVAAAWLVANAPLGLYGAWRLTREARLPLRGSNGSLHATGAEPAEAGGAP